MKRVSYVDKAGKTIDHTFESKKPFLNIFFVIGTICPLVIIGFIVFEMIGNNKCINIYDSIKKATLSYVKDNDQMPSYDGETATIDIDKLYSGEYLRALNTNNKKCGGNVKITKYKGKIVYTLNVKGCDSCSTGTRYGGWSKETSTYPSNKAIVDVIPYYNYFERQVSMTDWTRDFYDEELEEKESKYGVRLPLEKYEKSMPKVPTEGNIVDVQMSESYQYHYKDTQWRWYDIVGDYSEFSSEQPAGYAKKDESTLKYTEWTEFSLDHPNDKDYRTIQEAVGYKFYYIKDGKKVYANNGKYTAREDNDNKKYNRYEEETAKLYRYRDQQWRWYNGTKRQYTMPRSTPLKGKPYRDDETKTETSFSTWSNDSKIDKSNESYRTEERRSLYKFRYVYEILSLPVLKKPLNKEDFTGQVLMSVPEFAEQEDYKLDISYKFIYRKR